jgi:hypothetical protein
MSLNIKDLKTVKLWSISLRREFWVLKCSNFMYDTLRPRLRGLWWPHTLRPLGPALSEEQEGGAQRSTDG